jgi:leucine dehydrogenase
VAGAANTQLAEPADRDRLHARGILYAPDYVVNGGGAIALAMADGGSTERAMGERIDGIGKTLSEIFADAQRRRESPVKAAERRVKAVLEAGLTRG